MKKLLAAAREEVERVVAAREKCKVKTGGGREEEGERGVASEEGMWRVRVGENRDAVIVVRLSFSLWTARGGCRCGFLGRPQNRLLRRVAPPIQQRGRGGGGEGDGCVHVTASE